MPGGLEGGPELVQQSRRRDSGEPDIPFETIQHRGPRQVGGADVGGVEAGVAFEQPGLGVQAGAQGVVLDADLGTEVADQPIQCPTLRGAHVGVGDHAQRDPTLPQVPQLILQHPDAVPLHEGAQHIHAVGRGHLLL